MDNHSYKTQKNKPNATVASFHKAYNQLKRESPLLTSYNQYLVADALYYAQQIDVLFDLTSICAHTGLQRSSLKITLTSMEKEKLINFSNSKDDARRKIVTPTKILLNQYLKTIKDTEALLKITAETLRL